MAAPALAQPVIAQNHMVVTSHPAASEAGQAILRAGGSAVDAAIAVQAVLTLVEPQSSGIGGGAFLLHWNPATRELATWDGRETAPAAARGDLFLRDGRPMDFFDAIIGGRAVGVPGVMRMLEEAHRAHGKLPWAELFAPAIRLAEEGFPVSPRLARLLAGFAGTLRRDPGARAIYFTPEGAPLAEGARLRNPALAATLRAIAEEGANALHRGPIAQEIVRAVRGHANPGLMTADDLAGYAPHRGAALCLPYRVFALCGPPPPSGAAVVLQIMGLLGHFDVAGLDPAGLDAAMLISEAGRLAFADRNRFMADPAFIPVPVSGLLDAAYLTARAQMLSADRAIGAPQPGNPRRYGPALASQPPQPEGGTAHMSILDAEGRAVSMTTTVESAFGAHVVVRGFFLNNQLSDFSFLPEMDGRPVANRVEGGKRPRSSMSPMLVFRQGELEAVAGSPGGARIIGYVAQALAALLDWNMDPQAASALPHVGALNAATELERGTAAAGLAAGLIARGAPVDLHEMNSGLNLIRVQRQGEVRRLLGGTDPRREGMVAGD
ncbi:gamma-glutamyltransferase [Sediminicoccus sp. KRV36]|uniref:gamma-glutamyltransferase n=1 Tax=Sediminicoccus sp. KRV36 TaxID=3133721 RepID=UPI00200D5F21|nr:gamma-glutamyltransferase [Sediminicoccus rosea]UPY39169.1 gamma-glutamyltransferase [Sediminicoccus rosea]